MKKMLSTILVAVAFAAISTVDAKQMVQRGQKSMSESASNLLDVSKAAMNGQASGQELLDALKQEPQTPEEQKTVALIAEIKDLENKKAAIQDQMSQQKWFGFFRNTTEEKEANNKLKESLNAINGQLTTAKNDLNLNKKEVSRSWYSVSVLAVKTAVAISIPLAVIADLYYEKGYTKGAMAEVRAGMPRTRAAAGRVYESGKGYARGAYERLPSMRRAAPAVK